MPRRQLQKMAGWWHVSSQVVVVRPPRCCPCCPVVKVAVLLPQKWCYLVVEEVAHWPQVATEEQT